MNEQQGFEQWCIVELFGHNIIAGLVSEQTISGQPFVRVDVPTVNGREGFTKFFGNGAIYAITPTTEELARIATRRLKARPIEPWVIPVQLSLSGAGADDGIADDVIEDDVIEDDVPF